jgi:predicted nucleic acid-binding protein
VYLLDTNVLTHYVNGDQTLLANLQRVALAEVAIPTVVVAEAMRGRSEFALKAQPDKVVHAHSLLVETWQVLHKFQMIPLNQQSASVLTQMQKKHGSRKRYADMMIVAMALHENHIVITRNTKHFADLLPTHQLANWIDDPPR